MSQLVEVLKGVEQDFQRVNTVKLPFSKETEFAIQILDNNEYLAKAALDDQSSLRNAIVNVAAVGLSLNPVSKLAYLLPRKISGKVRVILEISYMGLVKVATDSGSVLMARAEIIREKDKFEYKGPFEMPVFEPDFFSERGEIKGVFCVVKLATGGFITGVMNKADCYKIRDRSESYKAHLAEGKKSPWVTDEEEMMKKTIIRREYKMWPKTDRLDNAIDLLNQYDGIDFKKEAKDATVPPDELLNEIREKLDLAKKTEKALLSSLPKHDCNSINDFSLEQANHAIKLLNQLLLNKQKVTA